MEMFTVFHVAPKMIPTPSFPLTAVKFTLIKEEFIDIYDGFWVSLNRISDLE